MTVAQIRNGKTKMENHRQVPVINQACHKKLLTTFVYARICLRGLRGAGWERP